MIFHFLLLASLVYTGDASTSLLSLAVNSNEAPPPSLLSISYQCAPKIVRAGYQIATALDCLNLLTFILATTPNHKQPTEWSRPAHSAYERSSGTCSLVVRLVTAKSSTAVETASFDEIVAAAMRLIEVCMLNSDNRPAGEQRGGTATAGSSKLLMVIVHGTREAGGGETADSGNRTVARRILVLGALLCVLVPRRALESETLALKKWARLVTSRVKCQDLILSSSLPELDPKAREAQVKKYDTLRHCHGKWIVNGLAPPESETALSPLDVESGGSAVKRLDSVGERDASPTKYGLKARLTYVFLIRADLYSFLE
ncbi:hypothetical protein BDR22DRAFT_909856 [Usnea florida]